MSSKDRILKPKTRYALSRIIIETPYNTRVLIAVLVNYIKKYKNGTMYTFLTRSSLMDDDNQARLIRHDVSILGTSIYISTLVRSKLTSEIIANILSDGFHETLIERTVNTTMLSNSMDSTTADNIKSELEVTPNIPITERPSSIVKTESLSSSKVDIVKQPTAGSEEAENLYAKYIERGVNAMQSANHAGISSGNEGKFTVEMIPNSGVDMSDNSSEGM